MLKNHTSWSLQDRRALITMESPSTFKALQKGKTKSSSPKHSLKKRKGEGHASRQTPVQQSCEFSCLVSGVLEGEHSPSRASRSWHGEPSFTASAGKWAQHLSDREQGGDASALKEVGPDTEKWQEGRAEEKQSPQHAALLRGSFSWEVLWLFPLHTWPGYLPRRK